MAQASKTMAYQWLAIALTDNLYQPIKPTLIF